MRFRMGNNQGAAKVKAEDLDLREQEPHHQTGNDKSVESVLCGNPPYRQRKYFIREIQHYLGKHDNKAQIGITNNLTKLRCAIGLESNDKLGRPDKHFILDEFGIELVVNLTQLLINHPNDWETDAKTVCHQLLAHYGPPVDMIPQDMPDTTVQGLQKLSLVGIDLSRRNGMRNLSKTLYHNRELKNVELAYTRVDNAGIQTIFPAMAAMPRLSYVGLRGNSLRCTILNRFTEILESEQNFPGLLWVDFTNNVDIFILPDVFLELLQRRWPHIGYKPSFRDLADGKAVVSQDVMELKV